MFFEEITASSLIKVDGEGNLLGESDYPMNPAGFVIHGAIHMSGDERHCVLHTHSRYGTAVSMQKHGLLPVSQKALTIMGFVGYHDFEGPAVDAGEQPRIVKDIEGKSILILRNHGFIGRQTWAKPSSISIGSRPPAPSDRRHDRRCGLQQISEATQQKSIDMGLNMYSEGGFLSGQNGRCCPPARTRRHGHPCGRGRTIYSSVFSRRVSGHVAQGAVGDRFRFGEARTRRHIADIVFPARLADARWGPGDEGRENVETDEAEDTVIDRI